MNHTFSFQETLTNSYLWTLWKNYTASLPEGHTDKFHPLTSETTCKLSPEHLDAFLRFVGRDK